MKGVLKTLGFRRQVVITVPVAIAQVRAHLSAALRDEIVLAGQWQLMRIYWGQMNYPQFALRGPRAHRQFCFLTQGRLSQGDTPDQTRVELQIVLDQASEMRTLSAIAIVVIGCPLVLQLFSLLMLPIFLGFLYGMMQWHFEHYTAEISRLLKALMLGEEASQTNAPGRSLDG